MKHTNIRQITLKEQTERIVGVWLSAMVHVQLGRRRLQESISLWHHQPPNKDIRVPIQGS